MLSMIGYVVVVSMLLSLAGLVAEYAAKQRRTAKRWIWLFAIATRVCCEAARPWWTTARR
jgi:hypothetical protein